MATATTELASSMREQANTLRGEADRLVQAAEVLDPNNRKPTIRKAGTTRRRRAAANGRRTRQAGTRSSGRRGRAKAGA